MCLSDLLPAAHRPRYCISSLFRKLWSPGKWFLIRNENAKLQFTLSPPFLSDPIPIIGYACHSLPTDCRLVNSIDVTLACEDAYSKLVEVVTVADVDDENHVGNSLLQIWKLRFGYNL